MPFDIVHLNVALLPAVMPVTAEVADVGVVTVAVPLITLHVPVPVVGVLPARVKLALLHWLMSVPAFAVVGVARLVITTSSVTFVHTPLEIVHRSVALLPAARPVTVVVADDGVVTDTAPLTTLQLPVPVVAAEAAIVKVPLLH